MPLNKNDLKQIRGVVREEVNKRANISEKRVEKQTEQLAIMTKNEFDLVHAKLRDHDHQFGFLKKANLAHIYNESEMVIKPEYHRLEERVSRIEKKVGLKK